MIDRVLAQSIRPGSQSYLETRDAVLSWGEAIFVYGWGGVGRGASAGCHGGSGLHCTFEVFYDTFGDECLQV